MSPDGAEGGRPMGGEPTHTEMEAARRSAGVSMNALWLHYFELTGDAAPLELEAFLQGLIPLPAAQRAILAQALHECVMERRVDGFRRTNPADGNGEG